MNSEERALIKKIEAKFPRDKAQKGEIRIELNGESVCPAREAIDRIEYILGQAKKIAQIGEGTFRIAKVASAGGAAKLAGLNEEECDIVWDLDLWFVIPDKVKDPTQEFGPCYTIYFQEKK